MYVTNATENDTVSSTGRHVHISGTTGAFWETST